MRRARARDSDGLSRRVCRHPSIPFAVMRRSNVYGFGDIPVTTDDVMADVARASRSRFREVCGGWRD